MPAAPPVTTSEPDHCARTILANGHAPHAARSFIRRMFGDRMTGDLLMVTDELVSNAVEHARGTSIVLSLQRLSDGVLVEVADSDRTPPALRPASLLDESGRGLGIVAALSARWGWRPEEKGKVVFAVVPLDGEQ